MPKMLRVLERDDKKRIIGNSLLKRIGEKRASVKQAVHDGDTVNVDAAGDFGVRLLGIDTPEISYRLPGGRSFPHLSHDRWTEFLTDPLAKKWGQFDRAVPQALANSIRARTGANAAADHFRHAQLAEDAFESLIETDMREMMQTPDTFGFFMSFAFEVMDGYGRFLCFINRDQPDRNLPGPRPLTYNERLLAMGVAFPYFIWPNIDPFNGQESLTKSVPPAGRQKEALEADTSLQRAREFVRHARSKHIGVFHATAPTELEPFELRWLAGRSLPHRFVIDMTMNNNILHRPENYLAIPHPEDRLWIPSHFVPLFETQGWQREA